MGTDKRSRLTVAELLVTAAIVAVLVPLLGSRAAGSAVRSDQLPPQTQERSAPPSLCACVLPRFDVRDEDLPTVVARLSGEHHVPCGLALVPDRSQTAAQPPQPPFERLYTLFEETHVACIVTTLTDIDRAFVSGTTDDFATIGLPGTFSSPSHPLQTVIPEFTARNVPWPIALFGGPEPTDAAAPAPLFRSKALPPDFRVTMDTTGRAWSDYPTITYETTNHKLLDIINDIARQLGLSWRLLDRSLLGGSGVEFSMGAALPTTPDLAAPLPDPGRTAPLGRPPAIATGEAAVARALRFFQDVGWEPDRGGQHPTPEPIAAFPVRRHESDCWEVTLANLTAKLDQTTGVIVDCDRSHLFRPPSEDAPTIQETAANELALSYLSAGGVQLDDAIIWKSELTRDRDAWRVYLRREHNGLVFQDQDWDLVILEPEDGSLRGYGHNFRSPLPESTRVLLTEEQAVSLARDHLAGLALEAGGLTSAELLIVQPDDYWEYEAVNETPPAWELAVALQSRLAWVVIFDKPWEGTMVWIDSETGVPLGGAHTRTMPEGDVKMWRAAPYHRDNDTGARGPGWAGGIRCRQHRRTAPPGRHRRTPQR